MGVRGAACGRSLREYSEAETPRALNPCCTGLRQPMDLRSAWRGRWCVFRARMSGEGIAPAGVLSDSRPGRCNDRQPDWQTAAHHMKRTAQSIRCSGNND